MPVLSHPLMDCGCSLAYVAYKNGELSVTVYANINKHYTITAIVQKK